MKKKKGTNEMHTIYKVGQPSIHKGVTLYSAIINGEWCQAYVQGEPARAQKGSYLFAFATIEQARKFFNERKFPEHFAIWEAETPELFPVPSRIADVFWEEDQFSSYWLDYHDWLSEHEDDSRLIHWERADTPTGTVFCKELTLTRRVHP